MIISGADKDKALYLMRELKNIFPKNIGTNFLGITPPDIFVGRFNYPNVYSGILAPVSQEEINPNSPEDWFSNKLKIEDIVKLRASMIYSRFPTDIRPARQSKLVDVMKEVSMSKKSVSMEFILKKKPTQRLWLNKFSNPLANPALLEKAVPQENISVEKKVESITSDCEVKLTEAIMELFDYKTKTSEIIRLMSSGLLGLKTQRKLVPSRWSTTAVDSLISQNLINNLKHSPWINDIMVFSSEYLGNHYEFILLPTAWSFEVIEMDERMPNKFWHDYEGFWTRTNYAKSVTGAYYSNRLAVSQYLNNLKRQASVIVLRHIKRSYYVHLGVGILREASKDAFTKRPYVFENISELKDYLKARIPYSEDYIKQSFLIKRFVEQKKII